MKNIFSFLKKKKERKELFDEASEYLCNHFKGEFGNDIIVGISITNADYKDDFLKGEMKIIYPSNKRQFYHSVKFKK